MRLHMGCGKIDIPGTASLSLVHHHSPLRSQNRLIPCRCMHSTEGCKTNAVRTHSYHFARQADCASNIGCHFLGVNARACVLAHNEVGGSGWKGSGSGKKAANERNASVTTRVVTSHHFSVHSPKQPNDAQTQNQPEYYSHFFSNKA